MGKAAYKAIEVRAVCPQCGSERFVAASGGRGRIVYRECKACGCRRAVTRYRNDELVGLTVRGGNGTTDEGDER